MGTELTIQGQRPDYLPALQAQGSASRFTAGISAGGLALPRLSFRGKVFRIRKDGEEAPIGNGPFRRTYSFDGIFRGVRVQAVELGGDRTLVYDESGFAAEAGSVTLGFRGETLTVTVARGSGLMSIEGLDWVDPGS